MAKANAVNAVTRKINSGTGTYEGRRDSYKGVCEEITKLGTKQGGNSEE